MILAATSKILASGGSMELGNPRIEMSRLLHVRFSCGSGIVLNLSEEGMAIQTMVSLELGQVLQIALQLPGCEDQVTGTAEVVWRDCSGRGGLHFADISERDRLRLTRWLRNGDNALTHVLCNAELHDLGSSRSSALLNAEVNCLQYLPN